MIKILSRDSKLRDYNRNILTEDLNSLLEGSIIDCKPLTINVTDIIEEFEKNVGSDKIESAKISAAE